MPSGRAAGAGAVLARTAIIAIACAAIICAPLPIGCSDPWSRLALEVAMMGIAMVWALFICRAPGTVLRLLAGCAVACVQLLPLPDGLLTAVAPVSAGTWKVANIGSSTWGTISIDPAATAVGIRRIFLWLAATLAIKEAASEPKERRSLVYALAASAVVIWALGLTFPVDTKERLLLGFINMKGPTSKWWKSGDHLPVQSDGGGFLEWAPVGNERYRYDEVLVGDGFGPYATSNQFAGGLCLTLPFLFAVVVQASRRLGRPIIGYALVGALMAASIWTLWERAGSRAGTASLLMAQAIFLVAVTEHSWMRRIMTLVAAVYGIFLLLLIAGLVGLLPGLDQWFPSPLQAKIASFLQDPRAIAANVARRMFMASSLLGTGINSYAAINPRFNPGNFTLYYAYNDYTQLLAETRLVGVAVAIAWVMPLLTRVPRIPGIALDEKPLGAAAAAAVAGLTAHTAFEWNLHQPANAFLACVAVGLFMAVVPRRTQQPLKSRMSNPWLSWMATAAFVIACGLAMVLLARDARSDAAVKAFRHALMAARPAPKGSARPAPKPLLERALEKGEQAAAWDPRNATLALLTGQSWLHLSQLESGSGREAALSQAGIAFRKAQRRRAAILGLPERQ